MLPTAGAASSKGRVRSPARRGDHLLGCQHHDLPRVVHHILRHMSVFARIRIFHQFQRRMIHKLKFNPALKSLVMGTPCLSSILPKLS